MKKLLLISVFALSAGLSGAQIPEKISAFKISDVKLTESQFLKNQNADIHYILGLDADRLLAPYMKEAGLKPKAENYSNWENTGLDGHIGGQQRTLKSARDWIIFSRNSNAVRTKTAIFQAFRAAEKSGRNFMTEISAQTLSVLTTAGCRFTTFTRFLRV